MVFDTVSSPTMSNFNNACNVVTQTAAGHDASNNNNTSPSSNSHASESATSTGPAPAPVQLEAQQLQQPALPLSLNFQHLKVCLGLDVDSTASSCSNPSSPCTSAFGPGHHTSGDWAVGSEAAQVPIDRFNPLCVPGLNSHHIPVLPRSPRVFPADPSLAPPSLARASGSIHQSHRHHHHHLHTSSHHSQDSAYQSPLASPGILSLEQLLHASHLSTAPGSTPQSPATPQRHSFPSQKHQQRYPISDTAMSLSPIDSFHPAGPSHADLGVWIASTMHGQGSIDHCASERVELDHFINYPAYPEVHVNGLGLVDDALACLASPIANHHHQAQALDLHASSSPLVPVNVLAAGSGGLESMGGSPQHGLVPQRVHWHQLNPAATAGRSMSAAAESNDTYTLPSPVPSTRSSAGPADQRHGGLAMKNNGNNNLLGYKGSPPPTDLWSLPLKSSLDLDVFSHGSATSSAPTSPSTRLMTFAMDPEVIKQALLMQIGSGSSSDSSVDPSPLSSSTLPSSREAGPQCMDLQALFSCNSHSGQSATSCGQGRESTGSSVFPGTSTMDDDSPPSPPATPMIVNSKQVQGSNHVEQPRSAPYQVASQLNQAQVQMPMPMHIKSAVQASPGLTSPVLPSPMTAAFFLAQQTPLPPTPTTPSTSALDAHAPLVSSTGNASNLVSYPETLPAPTKLCPAPVRRPRMRKRSTLSGDDGMGRSAPVGHHPYAQPGISTSQATTTATGSTASPPSPVPATIAELVSASSSASSLPSLPNADDSAITFTKLYTCIKCDKSFKRKADCVRHARVHTGEKPYRCPCGESFARQDALRRHQSKAPLESTCRVALLNGGVLPSAFLGDDGIQLSPGLAVVGGRAVTSLDRSPAALACVVALAPAPAPAPAVGTSS